MCDKKYMKCLSVIDKDTEFLVPRMCIEWARAMHGCVGFLHLPWVSSPAFKVSLRKSRPVALVAGASC